MRVTVIGAGHVGLVTAACLAHVGHDVVVDDDDASKLDLIRQGRSWFYEPGLEELLGEVVRAGRLRVAGDKAEAVGHGTVIFICVGTPSRSDGSPNLAFVEAVAREVARSLPPGEFRLVCEKSTVPVQTGERVAQVIAREARPEADWEVASNPEFLREGSAVVDTIDPDRVVVGTSSERGLAALRELYDPILERSGAPFLATDRATAELIKHASNAFLATKISFINSVAAVCERSGADVELVARGMGLDPRIGRRRATDRLNKGEQRMRVTVIGAGHVGLVTAVCLARIGHEVVAYDPVAGSQALTLLPGLQLAEKAHEVADGAHALVLMTEWAEFAELDPGDLKARMRYPIIVDARNFFDVKRFVSEGFTVAGVGRPVAGPSDTARS